MHYSLDNLSLSGVPNGTHLINLSLVGTDHMHFDPAVWDEVTVTVEADEPPPATANLFFSEAAEGSSNNKYLEVYIAGDAAVDLSGYAFPSVSNAPSEPGMYEYWNTFSEGATVEAGDVYVICHGSADDFIQGECDHHHTSLSNGDDGY